MSSILMTSPTLWSFSACSSGIRGRILPPASPIPRYRRSAQILDKLGVGRHLVGIYAQLLDNDVLDSLFNHFSAILVSGSILQCLCHVANPSSPDCQNLSPILTRFAPPGTLRQNKRDEQMLTDFNDDRVEACQYSR
jgi:hypothetical protein